WLLAAIGAWLGWPALLPVVLLSAVQGAIVGSILLAVRREPAQAPPPEPVTPSSDDDWVPPKHAVPYGPFLSLAALEYLFFGDRLVSGWNHLLFRLLS
ncbi:MAG TPA: prepilin peptidase, partial [Myxococcales bacterium]|nr:prepilin peptidase [Myxococcales bacterium]